MSTVIASTNPLFSLISAIKKAFRATSFSNQVEEKKSAEAYDLWAENYDAQPGNLMLDMDEEVFAELLSGVTLKDKSIVDIGCGTGRHWPKLLKDNPATVTGFDVSAGMLKRLEQKFPNAQTYQITDNLFSDIKNDSYDVLVSTLTMAHIENMEEALTAWLRIVKHDCDIIITDFHPNSLAFGGKRTFQHDGTSISIQNFVHYVYDIENLFIKQGFRIVNKLERTIDESVRHYYEAKNALHVYEKFKDSRIIYGIHLKRGE